MRGSGEPDVLVIGAGPAPGERYLDRAGLTGTRHTALLFGDAPEAEVAPLRRRWRDVFDVLPGQGDPARAGLGRLGDGGQAAPAAVLVRPDGFIGFRAVRPTAPGSRPSTRIWVPTWSPRPIDGFRCGEESPGCAARCLTSHRRPGRRNPR
jgi:hypothetical protein